MDAKPEGHEVDETDETGHSTDDLREPPNSTVDDWLGQRVGRDEGLAERLLAEEGGDTDAAARRFEEESEAESWHQAHEQGGE
jgi:hypothetical protein